MKSDGGSKLIQCATIAEAAAEVFYWLEGQDRTASAQRDELLATGVSTAAAWALYPSDFGAIGAAINRQLRDRPLRAASMLDKLMEASRQLTRLAILHKGFSERHPDQLCDSPEPDFDAALQGLTKELRRQFGAAGEADTGNFCASAIWYLWLFNHMRAQLTQGEREVLDEAAHFFGLHLLRVPNLPELGEAD